MPRSLKDNVSETATWIRLIYLIVYAGIFSLVGLLVILTSVSQFLLKLFTGRTNSRLKLLGRDLGIYIGDIVAFVTFHGANIPYPFSAWPSALEKPAPVKKTNTKRAVGKTKSTAQKSSPRRRKTVAPPRAPQAGESSAT